jgi:chemotaxis protein CheZ
MISIQEEDRLKKELIGLFGHLSVMRRELASLRHNDSASFDSMSDTLDAIVENTETASNTILENMENIASAVEQLQCNDHEDNNAVRERIFTCVNQVFEACSFQDLTGQRITRVVKSLKFVEERINEMVRMWGKVELERVIDDMGGNAPNIDTDSALLHGPQRTDVAISQDDIDKLFG